MTGDSKLITRLNDLLGRELGRNPYGEPVFRWDWSDDLFWPAQATGRKIKVTKPINIPLIGDPISTLVEYVEEIQAEYQKMRQTRLRETWLITKWLSPEDLIHGGTRGLGRGYEGQNLPSLPQLQALWSASFPGADFPSRGWRIPTDASLPREPGGERTPNLSATEFFISQVRRQTLLSPEALLLDMQLEDDLRRSANDSEIEAAVRDAFPAFLNPRPGAKDGTFLSLPTPGTLGPEDSL